MQALFILRHSPYGSSLAREALDMALATAAFDVPVSLLFLGDGVWQLLDDQSTLPGQRNLRQSLDALGLYDITRIYACHDSLKVRGIDPARQGLPFLAQARVIHSRDIQDLLAGASHVVGL